MIVPTFPRLVDPYVRFYDMTDQDKIKKGKFESFDFAPAKAKLELKRNAHGTDVDYLPPKDELADEKDAAYVSGQENYKKHFHSRVISRNHATVRWLPTQQYPSIADEGSTHGTFYIHRDYSIKQLDVPALKEDDSRWMKMPPNTPMVLRDGDVIMLGLPVKNKDDFVPHKLFVEMYPSGKWRERRLERSMHAVPHDNSDSDDDVIEVVQTKVQRKADKDKMEPKKQLTVVLSDDESDSAEVEPVKPHVDKAVAESSDEDMTEDAEDRNIMGQNSEEEIGASDNEQKEEEGASQVDESESEKSYDSEEVLSESEADSDEEDGEDEERDEEDEEEEDEEDTSTAKVASEIEAAVEQLQQEIDNIDEKMEEDKMWEVATTLDEATVALIDADAEAIEGDVGEPMVLAAFPSHSKDAKTDEDALEDISSSSESSSSSGESSETKITEGTNTTPVKQVQETTVVVEEAEDVAMSNTEEEPAALDVTSVQVITSNKRSYDEVEGADDSTENITVVAAATPSAADLTPMASPHAPSLRPQKKIKTFTAGLAAGLVAGVVGTFVGLSSLALSDSSLM